ncbi:MAG: hypothetical protein LBL91_01010 [Lachnospiraceae bacterium]|jgi:hypothetical protein|nr:hypothetical protein [Lachnospiraceae bacterium]
MNILITGAVNGANEESKQLYQSIIDACEAYSNSISSPLDTMQFKGTNEERYKKAMELLKTAELIIAEMSIPSTGQGMELQEAVNRNIPIIIIAKEGSKISGLLLGTQKIIEMIYYKNKKELEEKLSMSLKKIHYNN